MRDPADITSSDVRVHALADVADSDSLVQETLNRGHVVSVLTADFFAYTHCVDTASRSLDLSRPIRGLKPDRIPRARVRSLESQIASTF